MVYVSVITKRDKINNLHLSVLKKHGFLSDYIVQLSLLQKEIETSCYEYNKMLVFASHCNDSIFDNVVEQLTIKLNKYLENLRKYWRMKIVGKYDGVRALFKGLGLPYLDEYDNDLDYYYGWSL